MKTLYLLTLILLVAVAIESVVIIRSALQKSDDQFEKKYKFVLTIAHNNSHYDYAELKDRPHESEFKRVLASLTGRDSNNKLDQYKIHHKDFDGNDNDYPPPPSVSPGSLKTDEATTSEDAKNTPPGDPHITQKVASNNPADITKILDTLKNSP